HRLEAVDVRRLIARRGGAGRGIEGKICLVGNADLGADEGAEMRLERDRRAWFLRRHGDRVDDLVLVAEGLETEELEAMRRRIFEGRGGNVLRAFEADLRRKARVARRVPIGLPTGLHRDLEARRHRGETA